MMLEAARDRRKTAPMPAPAAPFGDGATRRLLPDGRRLLLQHGPIDLVVEAWGSSGDVVSAYEAAWRRFRTILGELVSELPVLRTPMGADVHVDGPAARRMIRACAPHAAETFLTAMAAVAGSVADEVLEAMTAAATLDRAYVNNGGDIAFHLAPGQTLATGIVANYDAPQLDAFATLQAARPSRGIATSGWRGRSHSLGIADAVTVYAADAAAADVAATLIANAVDCDDPAIRRVPASRLAPDSDLGERLVTVDVGILDAGRIDAALDAGAARARRMLEAGRIHGALLMLQGEHRVVGSPAELTKGASER